MHRAVILLVLALSTIALLLDSTPLPVPSRMEPPSIQAASRDHDRAGNQVDAERKKSKKQRKKNKKKKRTKDSVPTCFGLPATIPDQSGEILGTPEDDVIIGDDAPNFIKGGAGIDRICGGGGDDELSLTFDDGSAFADGGPGNDIVLGKFNGVNVLFGGEGDDLMSGGTANDDLEGGPGNDTIGGFSGKDRVSGGDGNDLLRGEEGDDDLFGGEGIDRLLGGGGIDVLDGGGGTDACQQESEGEIVSC